MGGGWGKGDKRREEGGGNWKKPLSPWGQPFFCKGAIMATSTYTTSPRHLGLRRKGTGGIATISTPNLGQAYASHLPPPLPPLSPAFARKGFVAAALAADVDALTQNSLAAIPNDTNYAFDSVLNSDKMPSPFTPARFSAPGDDVQIGDTVDVPGSMVGTVRFIGNVQGRKGTFAGVELHREFASRGKNSGDVDG